MAKMTSSVRGAYRGATLRNLALKWIRFHRPDVLEALLVEVDKMFPPPKAKLDIPPSLRKLK